MRISGFLTGAALFAKRRLPVLLATLLMLAIASHSASAQLTESGRPANRLVTTAQSPAPSGATVIGTHGKQLISLADDTAHLLPGSTRNASLCWTKVLPAGVDTSVLAHASGTEGLFVITPAAVVRLTSADDGIQSKLLPPLPLETPAKIAVASILAGQLYVASDTGFWSLPLKEPNGWTSLPPLPAKLVHGSCLVGQLDQLTLFVPGSTHVFMPHSGWKHATRAPAPFDLAATPAATRYGAAHIFFVTAGRIQAYHVSTDTWTSYATPDEGSVAPLSAVTSGETLNVLSAGASVTSLSMPPLPTGYSWLDHSMVAAYLVAMIGMSVWFSRKKQDSNDYFRGGNRIPWWVSGMSLFATFASAISMMAMPGKAFAGDWTYFSQGLFALLVLPISLFVLAPFVRRLKIPTANAYLERRFGLAARLLGSSIAVFSTSLARQGSVLLLPSIALSTVMGVPVEACILVMGLVTLAYTFFGGFEAVVWTDTVQGFIMIGAVIGCLALAWSRVDMGAGEAWAILQSGEKLVTFDWSWSLAYPTAWIFLITTLIGTLGGVSSQDYIQRVQCTPDLRQARLAVATQLFVAVPLNLLLFGLGTVLYLFYRQHPADLSPAMKLDGIFPFFVAQQLPPGVSGIVVAALLAATMSTISSCNCSVADIITQDFYKRFKPAATDGSILLFGRFTTLASGLAGILTALWMANATMGSIWDLATLVTNLIGNGIVGLFTLGMLTSRAHQTGALIGVLSGMATVFWLQQNSDVTFWLFTAVGTFVTVVIGYIASLALPGRPPSLEGLTVFSLPKKNSSPT